MSQISRRQFYSCLKLISACQAGFSPLLLGPDTLHEDISPMALPRFSWFGVNEVVGGGRDPTSGAAANGSVGPLANGKTSHDLIELSQGSVTISAQDTNAAACEPLCSTDSEVEQNDDSSAVENSDVSVNVVVDGTGIN